MDLVAARTATTSPTTTDRAVRMIREVKTADPDKPFFLYCAHGAVHATQADMEAMRGRYDVG